jgi:hypothetical protein
MLVTEMRLLRYIEAATYPDATRRSAFKASNGFESMPASIVANASALQSVGQLFESRIVNFW